MSDNREMLKVIIEIPKETYLEIKEGLITRNAIASAEIIQNGIPLDDVKAEIEKTKSFHIGTFEDDNPIDYGIVEGFDKAIAILDNIGKVESEE